MSQSSWSRAQLAGMGAFTALVLGAALAASAQVNPALGAFLPHGVCYTWNPGLMWLHLTSDTLIGLAYFSIPIALVYFKRKRTDLPFSWIFQGASTSSWFLVSAVPSARTSTEPW